MAGLAVRLAAVAGAVLLLLPVAIAPDGSAAQDSAPPPPPSIADFVLLANDGTLPVQSGDVAIITASTPALPDLAPTANRDVTEAPPSLAALLGASSVIEVGQAVPAGLPGAPAIPPEFLGLDATGLTAEYFTGADLTGAPALEQAQPSSVVRLPVGAAAARVAGQVTIPVDGMYEFTLTATGAARMLVDGVEVAALANEDEPVEQALDAASGASTATVAMELTAGAAVSLQFEMVDETSLEPVLALGWFPPAEVASAAVEKAAEGAASADAVLIHVPSLSPRGSDAAPAVPGALPLDLSGLLTRVAASNPRIAVVTDAAADDALDWTAPAVLHAPTGIGDLESLAAVLKGEAQPSGTLPFALPLPHGPPPATEPESQQTDVVPPAPLYAPGHGLTYWTYQLRSISSPDRGISAVVEVAATGTAPGATNVYLAASTAGSQQLRPVGDAAIELAAGETTSVTIPLDLSALDLESPEAWPVTLHAGTAPDALTITAELAASEVSESPAKQQAEKPKKQPKQGGIVRPAVPGLALTTGTGAVMLENAVELDGRLRLTGTLPTVSVSDARPGAGTGWTVSARASDLTGPGGALPASNLGWVPTMLTTTDGVSAGPAVAGSLSGGQGLGEPAVLGHASRPVGTVQFGAEFVLETPATTAPGTYSGTLTVTLFPVG